MREPNHLKESHRYTVQCVLPFNLFNQQIFTYLYFWLVILSCFNVASIILWLYRVSPFTNFHYLERRLTLHFLSDEHTNEQELRHIFVYQYLQGDGTFMLRLLTSNVSDYVCTKIILELYRKFRTSMLTEKIGRESLFKPVTQSRSEENIENDDGSTDQTIAADVPPIPNPRQGKLFVENDILLRSSSDTSSIEHPHTTQRTVSFSIPVSTQGASMRFPTSPLTALKEPHRSSITDEEVSDQLILEQDIEVTPESDPSPSTLPLLPSSSTSKGPSPYATTYLVPKKRNEHEMPYIDDSISSGSTSGRSTNAVVTRQSARNRVAHRF